MKDTDNLSVSQGPLLREAIDTANTMAAILTRDTPEECVAAVIGLDRRRIEHALSVNGNRPTDRPYSRREARALYLGALKIAVSHLEEYDASLDAEAGEKVQ